MDTFYYYLSTLAFISFIVALYGLYSRVLHNNMIEAERKLRLRLNEANSYFKGNSDKVPDFLQSALGDIGIAGIMDELGIDPGILKNPLVKGLVEKYAPRVLESLSKKGGGENETNKGFM